MPTPRIPGTHRTTLNLPIACDALVRARMVQMSGELGGHPVPYTLALASLVAHGATVLGTAPVVNDAKAVFLAIKKGLHD